MAGVREDWFPTPIWYFDVPGADILNAHLLRFLLEERERDATGIVDRSTVLGWHSADDLHTRPEMQVLMADVERNVLEVAHFLRWDFSKVNCQVVNCWAIINGRFASNASHIHPNSFLSGVYYVQADEDCGNLTFRDPRPGPVLLEPPLTERTAWTFASAVYQPMAGRMMIFPSWLYHGVDPNRSSRERVAISFNIGLIPQSAG